jgi:hypothetical protein
VTFADFLADVAAIYIGAAADGAFGSGRLIAPGLVLTAGHVVDYPKATQATSTGWKIRLLADRSADGGWVRPAHEAQLLWRGSGEVDLALLQTLSAPTPRPLLMSVTAAYDLLGTIDEVDAAGFPEAWRTPTGKLRDYRVRGSLRLSSQIGPYAWSVAPADKPDGPHGWEGMSGAAVCYVAPDDRLYLFGSVQQVPANFSSGLLEVARVSDAFSDTNFRSHLENALQEKPSLVRWVAASYYGFAQPTLTELVEKLKGSEPTGADWLERREKLAERAAVSERALANIAGMLGLEQVPTNELGPAIIDRIDRLHAAQSQIAALPAENPIKQRAETAASDGEYYRAEALLHAARGEHREAINNYRIITSLEPSYPYAWHDMLASYFALAKHGEFNITAMRRALAKTKQTGKGWPGLDATYLAELDYLMSQAEEAYNARRP